MMQQQRSHLDYETRTMPYRPPHDMSTMLGRPELALVRTLIILFAVAWCILLLGFVLSFRTRRS
jgi:hypothetical protein